MIVGIAGETTSCSTAVTIMAIRSAAVTRRRPAMADVPTAILLHSSPPRPHNPDSPWHLFPLGLPESLKSLDGEHETDYCTEHAKGDTNGMVMARGVQIRTGQVLERGADSPKGLQPGLSTGTLVCASA